MFIWKLQSRTPQPIGWCQSSYICLQLVKTEKKHCSPAAERQKLLHSSLRFQKRKLKFIGGRITQPCSGRQWHQDPSWLLSAHREQCCEKVFAPLPDFVFIQFFVFAYLSHFHNITYFFFLNWTNITHINIKMHCDPKEFWENILWTEKTFFFFFWKVRVPLCAM